MHHGIRRYRAVTGEQRLKIALDMTERKSEADPGGIRREFPTADEAEVDRLFRIQRMAANERKNDRERLTASAAIMRAASESAAL